MAKDDFSHLSDEELEAIASGKGPAPADDFAHLSDEQLESIAKGEQSPAEGPSTGQAALLGAQKGATFGFDDELAGAADYIGNLFVKHTSGLDEAGKAEFERQFLSKAYEKGRSEQQASQEAAQEAHPVAHFAGTVGGGAVTAATGGMAVKGAEAAGLSGAPLKAAQAVFSPGKLTSPGSMIRTGALGGATSGAIAGAGESGEGSRLQGAATGAGLGMITGGVLGGGLKLGRGALKAVGRYFDADALEGAAVGASRADLKKGDGQGSVKAAIKEFNKLGGFAPEPNGDGVSAEVLQERASQILDDSANEVSAILSQIDDKAPRTSGDNFDLSDVDAIMMRMDQNQVSGSQQKVSKEIADVVTRFRQKFSQFADGSEGASISELQTYKQEIQKVIADGGGYEPGKMPSDLQSAMRSLAEKVKTRIENVADMSLPRDQAGVVKKLNAAQSAALTLKPLIDSKVVQEAQQGIKTFGSLGRVVKFATSMGGYADTTSGQVTRAGMSRYAQGLSRNVSTLVQQLPEFLPKIMQVNVGLGNQIQQILKLPKNQMIPAMAPMMSLFGDYFEPAPYPSLLDGKLHDPADIESHREHIMQNVPSVSERAKQLSALNKDGTVAALPE